MRLSPVVVAIIEFGNVARADQRHEFLVAAGFLGQRHGQHGLPLLADFGALGDEAQTIEIHVGTGGDCHQRLVLQLVTLGVFLGASHRQRTSRLKDGARVLENILDRRTDGVGIDQHHFIDILLCETEGFLAHCFHRGAIGKEADLREFHALAGLQRTVHGIGIHRLDADDFRVRTQTLDIGRHAGNQPTAANTAEYGVDLLWMLAQDFHADGALPGDHVRIIEGMHEGQFFLLFQFQRVDVGLVIGIAGEHHFTAAVLHRLNLDLRGCRRHHDHRPATHFCGRQGDTLRMIAG